MTSWNTGLAYWIWYQRYLRIVITWYEEQWNLPPLPHSECLSKSGITSQDKFVLKLYDFLIFFQIQWVTRTELKCSCLWGNLFLRETLRSYNFFLGFKHSIHFQMLLSLTIHFRSTSITSFNLCKYTCSASETYSWSLRRVKIDADVGNVIAYFGKNKVFYTRI